VDPSERIGNGEAARTVGSDDVRKEKKMRRTLTPRRDGGKARQRPRTPEPSRTRTPTPSPAREPSTTPRLYATKNDLPEDRRIEVIDLLNQRLAEAIDLQTQCKQAHWNVKGPSFIGLHKLFDDINEAVEDYVDLIAERAVQLGGVAAGTVGAVENRSTLPDYPLGLSTGAEHVAALSDALAAFGRTVRMGIAEMDELEDADSADMLTEISRGVDKWLWFVESHQQSTS
jgi:starvation-inducible DNA-binding protein